MLRFFLYWKKGGDLLVYFVDYVRTKCDDDEEEEEEEIIDADAMIIIASFFCQG